MTKTQMESNTMGLSLEIALNVFLEYLQIWKKKKSEKKVLNNINVSYQ